MLSTRLKYILCVLYAFLLCSCSEQFSAEQKASVSADLYAHISNYQTRSLNYRSTEWLKDDVIGVFATGNSVSYSNVPYVYSSNQKFEKLAEGIYYDDNKEMSFIGYYPYKNREHSNDFESFPINTLHQNEDSQDTLDVMYASSVTATYKNPTVNLSFTHVMSKVLLRLGAKYHNPDVWDENISDESIRNTVGGLWLNNIVHSATFNVKSGSFSFQSDSNPIDDWKVDVSSVLESSTRVFTLFLIPQQIDELQLKVEIAGNLYEATLPVPSDEHNVHAFKPSNVYVYNLLASRDVLEVASSSVLTNWVEKDMGVHEVLEIPSGD